MLEFELFYTFLSKNGAYTEGVLLSLRSTSALFKISPTLKPFDVLWPNIPSFALNIFFIFNTKRHVTLNG